MRRGGSPAASREPKTAPAEVPMTTSARARSTPASARPARTPVIHAPPTGPPPPSTSASPPTPPPPHPNATHLSGTPKRGPLPASRRHDSIGTGEHSPVTRKVTVTVGSNDETTGRRRDARRNRELLLDAAHQVFTEQ